MKYTVRIRNNETGEVRSRNNGLEWHDGSLYWWTEGNMACDCNLQMEFARAGGEQVDMDEEIPCSDTRFTVLDVLLEDGSVITIDA